GCAVVSGAATHLNVPSCTKPVFLNANGRGYFVTDYSDPERKAIFDRLPDLNSAERIALRGNEATLVNLLRRDVGDYLALLQAMPKPADRTLVEGVAGSLEQLNRQLVTDANRAAWQRSVRSIMSGYAPATWTAPAGETDEARQARTYVLRSLGLLGADSQVISGAKELAGKFLNDPASVDRTEANTALSIAANFGDAALFERLTSLYEQATIPALRRTYLESLTQFRDPAIISRAID